MRRHICSSSGNNCAGAGPAGHRAGGGSASRIRPQGWRRGSGVVGAHWDTQPCSLSVGTVAGSGPAQSRSGQDCGQCQGSSVAGSSTGCPGRLRGCHAAAGRRHRSACRDVCCACGCADGAEACRGCSEERVPAARSGNVNGVRGGCGAASRALGAPCQGRCGGLLSCSFASPSFRPSFSCTVLQCRDEGVCRADGSSRRARHVPP